MTGETIDERREREGQTFAGPSRIARYASFVKLPHTVFALPFAMLGVIAASRVAAVTTRTVVLVVLAFTSARFAAMAFNRLVDRYVDARNPRTRMRELPSGKMTLVEAWIATTLAIAVFAVTSAMINPLCRALMPVALLWILAYSYAKYWMYWPHLWLGLGLSIAPVGGWIAVTGAWSTPWWLLLAITVAVTTWVAGFDIFYALPDEGFDRDEGLRSAVVKLGQRRAILVAKLLHGVTIPALALFGWGAGLGWLYFAGVIAAAVILFFEHRLVKPGDLSRLDAAFFAMNGVMSLTVFGFALVDRFVSHWS